MILLSQPWPRLSSTLFPWEELLHLEEESLNVRVQHTGATASTWGGKPFQESVLSSTAMPTKRAGEISHEALTMILHLFLVSTKQLSFPGKLVFGKQRQKRRRR